MQWASLFENDTELEVSCDWQFDVSPNNKRRVCGRTVSASEVVDFLKNKIYYEFHRNTFRSGGIYSKAGKRLVFAIK